PLLTGLPSLAWSHRKSSLRRLEREESRLAIRGNPQNRFARKSHSKGQNPANSITCARPVIQPIQWFLNFSRTTIVSAGRRARHGIAGPRSRLQAIAGEPFPGFCDLKSVGGRQQFNLR